MKPSSEKVKTEERGHSYREAHEACEIVKFLWGGKCGGLKSTRETLLKEKEQTRVITRGAKG